MFGPNGEIERVVGVNIDITERKEVEDSALEAEERFEELSGPGLLGAFDLNFAAMRCWFSPAWKRMLGYSPKDLT